MRAPQRAAGCNIRGLWDCEPEFQNDESRVYAGLTGRACCDQGEGFSGTLFRLAPSEWDANDGDLDLQYLWTAHAPHDGRFASSFMFHTLRKEPLTMRGDGDLIR